MRLNHLATPRKFWTITNGAGNGGKGIAEYTNRGVFSAGTNMGSGCHPSQVIEFEKSGATGEKYV